MAALGGVALGVFSRASELLPPSGVWVGNIGALWLVVAFGIGTRFASRRIGGIAGAATLVVAVLTHYVPVRLLRGDLGGEVLRFPLGVWVLIGITTGFLFGSFGAAYRLREPLGKMGVAALASYCIAEAAILWALDVAPARVIAVPLEILIPMVLPPVLYRSRAERLQILVRIALLSPVLAIALAGLVRVLGRVYPAP